MIHRESVRQALAFPLPGREGLHGPHVGDHVDELARNDARAVGIGAVVWPPPLAE